MQPQPDTTHIGIAENQAVELLVQILQTILGYYSKDHKENKVNKEKEVYKDLRERKVIRVKMVLTVNRENQLNQIAWVFKQSELQPSKPNFFIPTPGAAGIDGWFDGPGSTGRWWMSMGLVDGSTDTVATWTDPVQCTGEDGKTNSYMDFKYAKSAAETIPPPLDRTVRFPEGWTDEPPTLIKGEFMWMINALIDENGDLVDKWVGPIRITGESGPQGEPGEGLPGVSYKTVFAYKSSEEEPEKPVGGSWDSETNEVVYPEGWQGNDQKLTPQYGCQIEHLLLILIQQRIGLLQLRYLVLMVNRVQTEKQMNLYISVQQLLATQIDLILQLVNKLTIMYLLTQDGLISQRSNDYLSRRMGQYQK